MDCRSCKEQNHEVQVGYIAFESMKATLERTNRRLWIIAIILIALLFLTNAGWIYYESQFETVSSAEISQDVRTGEGSAYVSGIGDVFSGESETNNQNN